MLTITSILSTQFKTTRINFHLGVTNDFPAESMVKIYELRYRINNLSEFNFYYLKESVLKMKNFHHKGESLAGRVELPNYISDKIDKLIFFDVGDLLVLRDLTELYNYNMGEFWVLGLPEPWHINSFMIPKYNISKYINTGAMLLNIKMLKKNNFWDNYSKNKNLETIGDKAQTLFNILIPDNKKNYLPFNLGGYCLFQDDNSSDSFNTAYISFHNFFDSNLSLSFPNNPKSTKGILSQMHNPRFIHQFFGKWSKGKGLSITKENKIENKKDKKIKKVKKRKSNKKVSNIKNKDIKDNDNDNQNNKNENQLGKAEQIKFKKPYIHTPDLTEERLNKKEDNFEDIEIGITIRNVFIELGYDPPEREECIEEITITFKL